MFWLCSLSSVAVFVLCVLNRQTFSFSKLDGIYIVFAGYFLLPLKNHMIQIRKR